MTEHTQPSQATEAGTLDRTAERLKALQAARAASAGTSAATAATTGAAGTKASAARVKPSGPAPARILAAAASVAAGVGLVAAMTGAQPDVTVQVNPTPITVEIVSTGMAGDPEVRVVEAAVPAQSAALEAQPASPARPVTQSEGS